MSTSGFVGQHFVCHLTMVEQIKCVHSIAFKAPGLTIDKAGTVGEVLSYTFNANEGLIPQDMGIIGSTPGTFYLFADITSPYFVSASGAKIRKDKIQIQIMEDDTDGWKGTDHGLRWGDPAPDPSYWSEPDLHYRFRHLGGAEKLIQFDVTNVNPSEDGHVYLGIIGIGATYRDTFGRWIATPGVSNFYVYYDGKYQHGDTGSAIVLGTVALDIIIDGVRYSTTFSRRGVIRQQNKYVHTAPGPTTQVFGEVLASYKPSGATTLDPSISTAGTVASVTYDGSALNIACTVTTYDTAYASAYVRYAKPQGGYYSVGGQIYVSE